MADSGPPQPIDVGPRGRRHSILDSVLPDSLALPSSFMATSPMVREILSRDIAECSSEDEGDDYRGHGSRRSSTSSTLSHTAGHGHGPADDSDAASMHSADSVSGRHLHHAPSGSGADAAPLAFHPHGVAFGLGYGAVAPQGLDRPVANPREIEESRAAEVSLLRDNALIPPKHARTGWRSDGVLRRVYRRLFSTKVRDHEHPLPIFGGASTAELGGGEDGGAGQGGKRVASDETTPLLPASGSGATAEQVEDVAAGDADDEGGGQATPSDDEVQIRWDEAVAAHRIATTWQREAKTLVQYAAPLIATFLLHYSVTIGSVLTVGRLGMVELAAVNCECCPVPSLRCCKQNVGGQRY